MQNFSFGAITQPLSYVVSLKSNGNVDFVTTPLNQIIRYVYNDNQELTKVYYDKATTLESNDIILNTYDYNEDGLLKTSGDKSIFYNENGQLSKEFLANGSYTDYTYNSSENKITTTNSLGEEVSTVYYDAKTDTIGILELFLYSVNEKYFT